MVKPFRAIPGTHSATVKNHLFTAWIRKRSKLSKRRHSKRLLIEAARVIARESKIPKSAERKLARIEIQENELRTAREQYLQSKQVNTKRALILVQTAMHQLKEIYESRDKALVPESVFEELKYAHGILDLEKKSLKEEQRYQKNVHFDEQKINLIETINQHYLNMTLGHIEPLNYVFYIKMIRARRHIRKLIKRTP